MYSVVGCSECNALWVVPNRPETTTCRRCGTRYTFTALTRFAETETREEARNARTRLLADRNDETTALDEFDERSVDISESVVNDDEHLEGVGIDLEDVATKETDHSRHQSRREIVIEAIVDLDHPTGGDVIEYATDRGVPQSVVESILSKLRREGTIIRQDGTYRRL